MGTSPQGALLALGCGGFWLEVSREWLLSTQSLGGDSGRERSRRVCSSREVQLESSKGCRSGRIWQFFPAVEDDGGVQTGK